jgi:hypothetical protein
MPFNPNLFNAQPPPGRSEVVEGGGGGGTVFVIEATRHSPGNSGGGNSNNVQNSPNNASLSASGEEGSISAPYGSILTFTGFALSASMVGGTVTVVDPYVEAPAGMY